MQAFIHTWSVNASIEHLNSAETIIIVCVIRCAFYQFISNFVQWKVTLIAHSLWIDEHSVAGECMHFVLFRNRTVIAIGSINWKCFKIRVWWMICSVRTDAQRSFVCLRKIAHSCQLWYLTTWVNVQRFMFTIFRIEDRKSIQDVLHFPPVSKRPKVVIQKLSFIYLQIWTSTICYLGFPHLRLVIVLPRLCISNVTSVWKF